MCYLSARFIRRIKLDRHTDCLLYFELQFILKVSSGVESESGLCAGRSSSPLQPHVLMEMSSERSGTLSTGVLSRWSRV